MLALAICSGRRKSELTRFKVHYFDEENLVCDGALYKTPEPVRTKGFGNGKYIHLYTLAKKFKPYFDMWMKHRADHGIESEWLFPMKNDNSKHMKPETLNSWADTFTRMLGEDFYWHSMRHFFTTNMSRAGLPDGVIQSLVGWESGDMVYAGGEQNKLSRAWKELTPAVYTLIGAGGCGLVWLAAAMM